MENELLKQLIQPIAPSAEFEEGPEILTIKIPASDLYQLAQNLKQNDQLNFDYLYCLTGVDYDDHMEVVYHLKSTTHEHYLVVKALIPDREKPVVNTVSDIWPTANFHEREAYDFFGINFKNHPDLRRLFLTDDWQGWPLRKDYDDPVNIVALK